MPHLHGFQIKEAVNMSSPVVLITGALTGIGRATSLAFAHDGAVDGANQAGGFGIAVKRARERE